MRNAGLDLLILSAILVIAYTRPCLLTRFFNTVLGRVILLAAIVALATADTVWGIFGILILVSFRENLAEGLENMEEKENENIQSETKIQATITETPIAQHNQSASGSKKPEMTPDNWRKVHCKGEQVMLKDAPVAMSDFTKNFPNVEFADGSCNPCMTDCKFKVTVAGARLDAEEKLRAKNSNTLPTAQ